MLMPPLFEVPFKSSPTPIATVSTDLAVEFLQIFQNMQWEAEHKEIERYQFGLKERHLLQCHTLKGLNFTQDHNLNLSLSLKFESPLDALDIDNSSSIIARKRLRATCEGRILLSKLLKYMSLTRK